MMEVAVIIGGIVYGLVCFAFGWWGCKNVYEHIDKLTDEVTK